MRLPLTTLNSSLFTYRKKLFVIEASDLYGFDINRRIYDDAVDVGFEMVSERTGAKMVFCFSKIIKDVEGEIVAFEYVPADYNLMIKGIKVHVLND